MSTDIANIAIKTDLENERRDVKDLWNDALRTYQGIVGEQLRPTFTNVDDMIKSGIDQMNSFHKWRHNDTKVDKLRSLFMANIGHIEKGAQKLIAAAEPAFPPAAAIGTAVTFILAACRSVSADYDVITAFFEDMNSFLQRVSILEARLPAYRAYQACLMDVFTSLLKMCAFAQKFIRLGRLKKWIINAFKGEDGELAGSRKSMDTALTRLQSATEFAILANTENLVSSQQVLLSMQEELQSNQEMQYELAQSQQLMLQEVLERQADVKDELGDIKKLVQALQKSEKSSNNVQSRVKSATNPVRSVIGEIPENDLQLQILSDSHLAGTSTWILEEPSWKSWFRDDDATPLLLLKGAEGVGKSHLAMSALRHIEREIQQDPGNFSCVVYFFAQESVASLKKFQSIINCAILQVSEQNINLRDQLNAQLSHDSGRLKEVEYLEHLLIPMFSPTSKHQLYLVIDAVDALETNHDRDSIFQLTETIRKRNLRIKILGTGRPHVKPSKFHALGQSEWSGSKEILVDKNKFARDLKLIAQHHLQSSDSAFRGLRYLRQDVKSEIVHTLEAKADGLLYAQQALLYMSNLGRELAIRTLLSTSMPVTVLGWFYRLIDKCERRTPADLHKTVQTLNTWLLFAFDSLSVSCINDLLRLDSGKKDIEVEDEILDIYKDFVRITTSSASDKTHKSLRQHTLHDGTAHLTFRERAMSTFFLKRQSRLRDLKISVIVSHGHRSLFLLCCRVIQEYKVSGATQPESFRELHRYALRYCLRHLRRITSDMHTDEENAEVCEVLSALLTNKTGFATQIEDSGPDFTVGDLITFDKNSLAVDWDRVFLEGWDMWSNWVKNLPVGHKSQLSPTTVEFLTKDRTQVLLPLAEAHLQNFLLATDPVTAINSYSFGRKTLRKTCKRVLLCEYPDHILDQTHESEGYHDRTLDPISWHNEVLRLRKVNSTDLDSNSHYVTAILSNLVRGNEQRAIDELEIAIEKCKVKAEEVRYIIFLSRIYFFRLDQADQALSYLNLALEERKNIPQELTLLALETKALVLARSQRKLEALSVYQELHTLNADEAISSRLLLEEFNLYMSSNDASKLMDHIESLDPTQRLNIVLNPSFWTNPSYGWSIHLALLEAALATDRIADLLRIYLSISASLGSFEMSPIWSPFIAHTYWTAQKDIDAAKATLNNALSSPCYVQEYPITGVDTSLLAMRNVNMLSDIILEQFQSSTDPEAKHDLFQAASILMQKELPQSVQINDSSVIPHSLIVATMTRKVGSAKEYEKSLRQVFDICWANLHDTVSWNDANSICNLSRVLAQMPGMKREAEILHSAQLYHLGSESMFVAYCASEGLNMDATSVVQFEQEFANTSTHVPEMFAELTQMYERYTTANPGGWSMYSFLVKHGGSQARQWSSPACTRAHICKDQERSTWSDGPLYTCLYCTDCRLCQTCYDSRMRWDNASEPAQEHSFCCSNGQYLRTPVAGWLGIKNKTIYIEGEIPVTMDEFFDNVRVKWNACWEQFWKG